MDILYTSSFNIFCKGKQGAWMDFGNLLINVGLIEGVNPSRINRNQEFISDSHECRFTKIMETQYRKADEISSIVLKCIYCNRIKVEQ